MPRRPPETPSERRSTRIRRAQRDYEKIKKRVEPFMPSRGRVVSPENIADWRSQHARRTQPVED